MQDYRYKGHELETFAHATNWKSYLRATIAPYVVGDVLEVGAGIGSATSAFCSGAQRSWLCLEPDAELANTLRQNVSALPSAVRPEVVVGVLDALPLTRLFDAILYVDVLEHIDDDRAELQRAAARLRPGGTIVVISPAHQQLYSEFDRRIGHFRRYTRAMYEAITPPGTTLEVTRYLDSLGMLLSGANRLLLRSGQPSRTQVRIWDRMFVTASRYVDPVLAWRVGKTIVGVWRKQP